MAENLGDFLLEMRKEHKNEMKATIKTTYIGNIGENFALKYLENLFERNNIKNYDINPHNSDQDDYDLEIYLNNKRYKIEVKFSTSKKEPSFNEIHFNNNFDYLLLIWHPNEDEIYFAVLTKEEAKDIATPVNTNREDEDNWIIQTTEIFDEDNKEFLKKLAILLEIDKELEDLEDEEKIEMLEDEKEEIMKNTDAVKKDFSGITYQYWVYEYLNNYTNDVEAKPNGDEYDIEYEGKHIEVKYSALNNNNEFWFGAIKPENFDYILFIGFDAKENKFYFEIESREEYIENKRERVGDDEIASQNGNKIDVGKSFFRFDNDFTFEDFDNYIETH